MRVERRQHPRFKVLGRVQCNEISPLPGSLIDVSQDGCKIYYTVPVTIHFEDDYTILFQSTDAEGYDITLICHLIWVNEDSGKTIIGMSVLRSPDSEKFNRYVEYLAKTRAEENKNDDQIVDTQCQFL